MSRLKAILLIVAIVVICFGGYVIYRNLYVLSHLKEAYAAWDTGTLLIEFMDRHDGAWPTSWDDLVDMDRQDTDNQIKLRGFDSADATYVGNLRELVRVDWSAAPSTDDSFNPVTRPDGSAFPIVWQGAEPNEMVRRYIRERAGVESVEDADVTVGP